jgi:CRP-like cAMP-binding protein
MTMDENLILAHVHKHITLTKEEESFFISLFEQKAIRKRDILLKAGDICRHSTFVVDGALKGYTRDSETNDHVINFAVKDWWIADLYSLISQKPAVLTIEALADSHILMLSKDKQEQLYTRVPKFERFFRILVENSLVASQQRLINNLTLTAEERYLHFIKTYPFVLECAPLHNIATYLGITPEFLSKIRRKLAGKAV